MRILKVTFENLNSLAGKWEIDFTDPEFVRHPLFVITGPTGAGKTTILDAISLALYGQTARLDAFSQTSNEIMTRGTAFCSADVVFEAGQVCYLAHWYQKRARNHIDGNLQQVERRIQFFHASDSDQPKDQVICASIKTCDEKIVELTGLTFEQFSQSIMLSQGQFTKFLKANANERADLLEKMTGTELYSKISRKVNEIYKQKEATKKELTKTSETLKNTLLDADQRHAHEQWLLRAEADIKTIDTHISDLKKQKEWLEDCHKQAKEAEAIARDQAEHDRQAEAFAPDRKRLEQGILAKKHETAFMELCKVQNDLAASKENRAKAEKRVTRLQQDVDDATKKADAAQISLLEAEKARDEAQPKIGAMIAADTHIEGLAKQVRDKQAELSANELDLNAAQKAAEADALKVRQMEEDIQKCRTWLAEHDKDRALREAYAGIEAKADAFKKSHAEAKKAEKALLDSKKVQQKHQEDLKQAQEKYNQSLEDAKKADAACQTEEAKYHALLNGKTLESLEEERNKLEEEQMRHSVIQSLEERRLSLLDGEPCPLCGSVHHPWAVGVPQNGDGLTQKINMLKTVIKKLRDSDKKRTALKDALSEAKHQCLQCQSQCDILKTKCDNMVDQSKTQEAAYTESVQANEVEKKAFTDAVRQYEPSYVLTQKSGILEKLKARIEAYKSMDDKNRQLENAYAQAKEKAGNAEGACRTKREGLEKMKSDLVSLQNEEKSKREERRQRYGEEKPDVLRQRLDDAFKTHKSAKDEADKRVSATQKALDENRQQIRQYTEESHKLSDDCNGRRERLLAACQADHFERIEAMESALLDTDTMKRLDATRNRLDDEKKKLDFRRAENDHKRALLCAHPLTDRPLAEVEEDLQNQNTRKDALNQTYGSTKEAIRKDDETRGKWREAVKAEEDFVPEYTRWYNLNLKIGSLDGKKFKVFVQNLTLKFLIHYANDYLKKLDARYKLLPPDYSEVPGNADTATTSRANKPKNENYKPLLNFKLIDAEMNDIRPTDNLSGGETFLVSLALALGLSAMASRNIRIDTLYIDEGFGTLDHDTLDRTLQALCEINGDGRQIGIISHVEALQEAIATKIVVSKNGQGGHSTLSGPGIRSLGR